MQITPYLQFENGNCRDALAFYADVLDGKVISASTFAEAPGGAPVGPEWQDKIMHAHFEAQGVALFACDSPPQFQKSPQGIALTLSVEKPSEAERIFGRFAEGGAITMEMTETFWASRFGMLTDRFGIPWMVSCDKPE